MRSEQKLPGNIRQIFWMILSKDVFLETFGDLEEAYSYMLEEIGPVRARIWFWLQVLKTVPVFVLNMICWRTIMFKNYFKIACRYIKKYKTYSLINITGFALGMACCILISILMS